MSFIGKIWDRVKDLGGKAWGKIKDLGQKYAPAFKETFRSIANTIRSTNPLSRPLELGEFHYGYHNYTGPGTRIDLHPNVKPFNNIDAASRIHDLEYEAAASISDPVRRAKAIQDADLKAIKEYSKYPKEDGYQAAMAGIAGKFGAEQALSFYKGKSSTFYG